MVIGDFFELLERFIEESPTFRIDIKGLTD